MDGTDWKQRDANCDKMSNVDGVHPDPGNSRVNATEPEYIGGDSLRRVLFRFPKIILYELNLLIYRRLPQLKAGPAYTLVNSALIPRATQCTGGKWLLLQRFCSGANAYNKANNAN